MSVVGKDCWELRVIKSARRPHLSGCISHPAVVVVSARKKKTREKGGRAGEELKSSSRFHLPLLMVFSYQLCLLSALVPRRRFLLSFFALYLSLSSA
jgi:hypothetical protein